MGAGGWRSPLTRVTTVPHCPVLASSPLPSTSPLTIVTGAHPPAKPAALEPSGLCVCFWGGLPVHGGDAGGADGDTVCTRRTENPLTTVDLSPPRCPEGCTAAIAGGEPGIRPRRSLPAGSSG